MRALRSAVMLGLLCSVARPLAMRSLPRSTAGAAASRAILLQPAQPRSWRHRCPAPTARGSKSAASTAAEGAESSGPEGVMERGNFLSAIMRNDLESGKHTQIVTRFPPEPNGYLHIGHAKSICINFGLGEQFGGATFMRFDDTNPEKEEQEYVDAIMKDVQWLGFDWKEPERQTYASNYFEKFYEFAITLIKDGKAYVDSLDAEQMREYRGTLKKPGQDSPYRTRSVEENLALFESMAAGEVPDGEAVLRLKIDMQAANMNLRDPAIYRVKRNAEHPMTGQKWKVYPMYDYAHSVTDALEGITHSLCTLEFEDHRALYDFVIDALPVPSTPRQIEFSRLNLQCAARTSRRAIRRNSAQFSDGPFIIISTGTRCFRSAS